MTSLKEAHQDRREGRQPGRYVAFQMAESASHEICSPTFCGSSRTATAARRHRVKRSFVRVEPNSRERCASMTENSAIFNARHGGGSFHPHRQPAPTAQDCFKRGTRATANDRQLSGECRLKNQARDCARAVEAAFESRACSRHRPCSGRGLRLDAGLRDQRRRARIGLCRRMLPNTTVWTPGRDHCRRGNDRATANDRSASSRRRA